MDAKLRKDFSKIDNILSEYADKEGSLITILQKTQDAYGYLPMEVIDYISEKTGIRAAKIYGVATFYSQFRLKPIGKYLIMLCQGTACHVNGSDSVREVVSEYLNIKDGEMIFWNAFPICGNRIWKKRGSFSKIFCRKAMR